MQEVLKSFCVHLYGLDRAKRQTERIIEELASNGDE